MWDLEHLKYAGIRTIVNTSLYVRRSSWLSPATQPNQVKTYPSRPNLYPSRIFTPPEHDGQSKLPLVIRAHGGGFLVNNPSADDPLARHLADHANCIVVSIDYSKSPQNKFPTAYEDAIAQILAAINDETLPVDRTRVVLCGSSAGGNLMLSVVQDPRLRPKVLGVATIFPAVDLAEDGAAKMARRPDPTIPDFIGDSYADILRLYLESEQTPSLKDPRVSPAYFPDEKALPANFVVIGAEHDMFCYEDKAMADKLADMVGGERVETETGWKAGGVQWSKIMGQPHAFDAFPAKAPITEASRLAAVDALYAFLSEWLVEVFAAGV
ncbi:hypothetical protein MBLNU13_g03456t1 [Cladosporium sp. NU13]